MVANLFKALKPGGVVVVQDHVANPGGDTAQVVDQLHRIDPKVPAQEQFEAVREFRREGLIRHVGLSEVSVADIERATVIDATTLKSLRERISFTGE